MDSLSQCGHCGSQKESFQHFLSNCPKFHCARTAAHNQVSKALAQTFGIMLVSTSFSVI